MVSLVSKCTSLAFPYHFTVKSRSNSDNPFGRIDLEMFQPVTSPKLVCYLGVTSAIQVSSQNLKTNEHT